MSRRRRKRPPTGLYSAIIESLSHEGRGVTHVEGKTVFVDLALPDEHVEFSYTGSRVRFAEGVAETVTQANAERVEPVCDYFGYCGGCRLQHMGTQFQIQHKQAVLLEQLAHQANVQPETVLEPLTGPVWGYRHKARLAVKHVLKKEKTLVGFREMRSPFVADIDHCEVLHPAIGKYLSDLQALVASLSIYDKIPQIEVAVTDQNTALVIRHLQAFTDDDLQKLHAYEDQTHFTLYLQPEGYDSVHLLNPDNDSRLFYALPDYDIQIHFLPTDFTQINVEINQKMIQRAIELLEPDKNDRVLDLFCGLGNFTLPISTFAKQVIGVEGDAGLIERAEKNAGLNQRQNVEFHVADLAAYECLYPFMREQVNKLLLDPPRTGAKEIISALNLKNIQRIVYVSCNPATLARDTNLLIHEKEFQLTHAGVMDMFPHTAHVESIAVLSK